MKNQPLYLKLAKQVLGADYQEMAQEQSPKDSPYIEYQPHQHMLRSRVLPDDEATQLKVSTLSLSSKAAPEVVPQQSQLMDFFEDLNPEQYPAQQSSMQQQQIVQQQQTALVYVNLCCEMNPLEQLSKYQLENGITEQQIVQNLIDYAPGQLEVIAIHPQGNFAFQKLYESSSPTQRLCILKLLNIFELSLSEHGTRSVQKIILIAAEADIEKEIEKQFTGKIVDLILNAHGNHCVEKILDTFSSKEFNFVVEECCAQLLKVACHEHGCCVLERCLDHCSEEQFDRIFALVKENAFKLVVDQYGNYVYQFLLDCNELTDEEINALIIQLYGKEAELTKMKSSSHVIEKCLTKGSPKVVAEIINNLISDQQRFADLCCDRYANYVIEKVLTVSNKQQLAKMTGIIESNMDQIGTSQFSRHIVNFVRGEI